MSNIFEVTDSRGRTIICTQDRWHFHILMHHPEMQNYLEEIQAAIKASYLPIARDANREERNIYYGLLEGHPRYVKVVVDFQEEKRGEVITAFLTDSPKPGEKPLW